jgi:rhamnosyltransferase
VIEVLSDLNLIPEQIDLFVSVTTEDLVPHVIQNRPLNTKKLVIELQENRGRDIGAFIRFLDNPDSTKYDCVLKIHGKKSEGGNLGDAWRTRLIRNLAPSPKEIRKIVKCFIEDQSIGIAGPREFLLNVSDFLGGNAENLENLDTRLGLGAQSAKSKFFAGSMFWFRPKALEGLKALADDSLPEEQGQIDGTWLHAVERLVVLHSETLGYTTMELFPTFEGDQSSSVFLEHHYLGKADEVS